MKVPRLSFLSKTAHEWLEKATTPVLCTLARTIFASVLFGYFWASGLTKIPNGFSDLLTPSSNAFAQIFPKSAEAVSYDVGRSTLVQRWTIVIGIWIEFLLPICIIVGLFTRIAAFGLSGFIVLQSTVDIMGHGATLGALFDRAPDSQIDQRAFWLFLLIFLIFRGGGPISVDRLLFRSGTVLHRGAPPK